MHIAATAVQYDRFRVTGDAVLDGTVDLAYVPVGTGIEEAEPTTATTWTPGEWIGAASPSRVVRRLVRGSAATAPAALHPGVGRFAVYVRVTRTPEVIPLLGGYTVIE